MGMSQAPAYDSHKPPTDFYHNNNSGVNDQMEQQSFEDGSYPHGLNPKNKKSNASVDPYRYQKEKFEQQTTEGQFQQIANNDDIFACYDYEDERREQRRNSKTGRSGADGFKHPG